jgi:hypothetical protein
MSIYEKFHKSELLIDFIGLLFLISNEQYEGPLDEKI